mgnify:FL=1
MTNCLNGVDALQRRIIKTLALLTCIGMFVVLAAGVLVTRLDAGRGCGNDWPLCNGRFVPAYTLESMVEYSHRFITGIEGILVLVTFLLVLRAYGARSEHFLYAAGTAFFTVLQAILGAMAVMWEQSDAVMALHFGISLLAFTFALLTWLRIRRTGEAGDGGRAGKGLRRLVWFITFYAYVVVYTGAYVKHTDSQGGCDGWPLCNGEWIPELSGAPGIAFGHRLAALLILALVIWLHAKSRRELPAKSELRAQAGAALVLTLLQIATGAFVVFALADVNWYVFAGLLHTAVIAALYGVLGYMSIRAWQLRDGR